VVDHLFIAEKMMKLASVLLILFTLSCKEADNRECWKFSGEKAIISYASESFKVIVIPAGLKVELIQDSINEIQIEGGENLIQLITWNIEQGELTFENKNKCSFLRKDYQVPVVKVHFTNLNRIEVFGSDSVFIRKQFIGDSLSLYMDEGSAFASLNVQLNHLDVLIPPSYNSCQFSGKAKTVKIVGKGNARVDSKQLEIEEKLTVSHYSSANFYVKSPLNSFKVEMFGRGNLYYEGDYQSLEILNEGEGAFIKL
jgi:hypothetical protein